MRTLATPASAALVRTNSVLRRCACGGTPGPDGECVACKRKRLERNARGAEMESRLGHDFSRVRVDADARAAASARAVELDGVPEAEDEEMDVDQGPPPGSAPIGAAATPACPTDIRLVEIIRPPLTAADVARGFHSGRGGVAKLRVSDPSGRNWNGTRVHENLTHVTNSCEPAVSACPNPSGQGGAAGSTFTVGRGFSRGRWSLPAEDNVIYDFHTTELRGSFLHDHGLATCERRCTQRYDCGGSEFGPTFVLQRLYTRDRIGSDDVTRVGFYEWEQPELGDFPERILPPGEEYA